MTSYQEQNINLAIKCNIFDIKRFSLDDGPGIRTVIFFQGCNLNCLWCHNPEGRPFNFPHLFYASKCIGCMECRNVCPVGLSRAMCDAKNCLHGRSCLDVCYAEAITIPGNERTIADIMKVIKQDMDLFKESKGGVTVSGGEPLCQINAVTSLFRECRNWQIDTLLETNGCGWQEQTREKDAEQIEHTKGTEHVENTKYIGQTRDMEQTGDINDLLKVTDKIYLDLKFADESSYAKIGGSLHQVLDFAQRAVKFGVDLTIRTPVIPGVNDIPEQLIGMAEIAHGIGNTCQYVLLPYNPLGNVKYQAMGLNPPNINDGQIVQRRDLQPFIHMLDEAGVKGKITGKE